MGHTLIERGIMVKRMYCKPRSPAAVKLAALKKADEDAEELAALQKADKLAALKKASQDAAEEDHAQPVHPDNANATWHKVASSGKPIPSGRGEDGSLKDLRKDEGGTPNSFKPNKRCREGGTPNFFEQMKSGF